MFTCWHDHLSSHVSAFFISRSLVFDMDSSHSRFNHHLCEFHSWSQTAKACISISNNWSKVIVFSILLSLLVRHICALLVLNSVVKKLCLKKLVNFIRYCVVGIVSKVWSWFIVSRCCRWALPARNVYGLHVLGLVDHLYSVERAKGKMSRIIMLCLF
jgi:hypothetical protein